MNKQRMKKIEAELLKLDEIVSSLESFNGDTELSDIRDEETEAFEAMPEGLQHSERGQASEEAMNNLNEAVGNIEAALASLKEAVEALEQIVGT